MASAQCPLSNREPRSHPEASRGDVLGGAGQPGQPWTPGWVDKAELDSAATGTWPQREDGLCPSVAEDCAVAMAQQPGGLGAPALLAWSSNRDAVEPALRGRACSLPVWSTDQEARGGGSSVSSGRLSGSSGGHVSRAPPHGPWKERLPRGLGSQRPPRKSDPRLERLRDRICQQARGQVSCASLGTSAPSSASRLCSASTPAPRRRTYKVTAALPGPAHSGLSILRVAEPREEDQAPLGVGQELSRATRHQAPGLRDKARRTWARSCRRDRAPRSLSPGRAGKGKDPESVGIRAWRRGQELARLLLGPSPARPARPSTSPSRDLGPAMALGDIKRASATEGSSVHTWPDRLASAGSDPQVSENTASLACHGQRAMIHTAMAILQDLRQQIQAGLELAQGPRLEPKRRASKLKPQNLGQQGRWSIQLRQGSCPKSPCDVVEGTHSALDRARRAHPQQPSSTSAKWEPCPSRAWEAAGWDPCFQRPPSPSEKLSPCAQGPWSALPWLACPQWAWVHNEDWEVPDPRPWSPLERPYLAPQRSWSGSYSKRARSPCKGRGATTPPSKAKQAWPWSLQGKELGAEPFPPHLQPRGALGQSHSSEALCNFLHQKAQAWRQQSLQQTVTNTDALERRSQKLQEVYRKQREAVQGKAVSVVSQTNPGIVTFVSSSAQSGDLKAPGSLEPPEQEWSKVTSGMVLGNQEVPGSFCLCLNRAWNRLETPLPVSATSSLGSVWLQDPGRGLHVCLDPQMAEQLDLSGPLHTQHKQARLQALETMANVLQQRIDILTAKLHRNEAPDSSQDAASELKSLGPSTTPTAPAYPGASLPRGDRGSRGDDFLDAEPLLWSPGATQEGRWQLEHRLQGHSSPFQAAGASMGSMLGVPAAPHPTCGSPWLEERPAARGVGLVTPWTPRSCGPQEPGAPRPRGRGGHLADFQLKSLRFLESLKLEQRQQQQEQALALLRQRAEEEVWETQMALDGLLFKHQLEGLLQDTQLQYIWSGVPRMVAEPGEPCVHVHVCSHMYMHRLLEKHRPRSWLGRASKLEQPQIHVGPAPTASAQSPEPAKTRSPPALGRDVTGSSQGPEEGQASVEGKSASADTRSQTAASAGNRGSSVTAPDSAGPTSPPLAPVSFRWKPGSKAVVPGLATPDPGSARLRPARLCPPDSPAHQGSAAGTGSAEPGAGRVGVRPCTAALEQSLREEGLRAQHWAPLLRLREMALEEKARAERAWLEHQRGPLDKTLAFIPPGVWGVGATKPQGLPCWRGRRPSAGWRRSGPRMGPWPVQREIRDLRDLHRSVLQGRQQLLQQQEATVQRLATLQQSPSPQVKPTWQGASETGQQLEGALCPQTAWRPGSPASPQAHRGPESAEGARLAPEPWEETPQTPADAAGHQQPPSPASGGDTAEASSLPKAGGSHIDQEPCDPQLGHLHSGSLDPGQLLDSTYPALEAKRDSPIAQLGVQEAPEPPTGDSQTQARACWAKKRPTAPRDVRAHSFQGHRLYHLGADGPRCPQEASMAEGSTHQAGLDVAGSPVGEPLEVASRLPRELRTETCWQDSSIPLAASPALPVSAAPAALEEEAASPTPPRPATPVHPGSEPAAGLSWASPRSPASSPLSSAGSGSGLACSSLQEFQKATATLVQLSDRSLSPSGPEAEGSPGTDPSWSEELSVPGDLGPPSSWGLCQGDPQWGAVPGGAGLTTWPGLECGQAAPPPGAPREVAAAEDLVPGRSCLQTGWPLPPQDVCSPRSGSELSEASSQVWDEDIEENLLEPGLVAQPTSGCSSPPGSSSWEHSMVGPALGSGQGQEPSETSESLSGGSNTGSPEQLSSEAASTSDLDLSLSFPSGTSASRGARCQERARGAGPSLSPGRNPPQASPGPEVPYGLASLVAEGQAAGCAGNEAPQVPEQAGPPPGTGFPAGASSPVDEEWRCGGGDLPCAPSWDAHLPPPPSPPPADSHGDEAQPCCEDFPSPPQEAMVPQGSLGPLEEDISIATQDLSLSEGAPKQALSQGSQELGLDLRASWLCRGPECELGGLGSAVGTQASSGQWSEQITWPESPLGGGGGSVPGGLPRAPTWPSFPSRGGCVAGEGLSGLLVAGDPDVLSVGPCALKKALGRCMGPQDGLQCFESTGRLGGSSSSSAPPQDPVPLVAHGQAGSLGHTGEEGVEGLSHWAEDSMGRELLPGEHSATGHQPPGSCSNFLGTERDDAVAVVSTQLTQRILLDSMAVLAPGGSL
ncbi:PREDICTED: uncharacterized protein LOC102014158 isoform X6 [Chinchilla lanigera]|uniref:uncharacterized protein LOC102014158 isoform X6 n=1 Tax=Chinchilla lanigera TaxID=34839 RepID=UPI000695B614|nr:PREDICTED: uncharacterized protein LOC102014158 isoform X6 [Chinchilla lanigera]